MYDNSVNYGVEYPERSSRLLALARIFLGWLYIGIPHGLFCLAYGTVAFIVAIFSFLAILISGHFPLSWFDFLIRFNRYICRLAAYCVCMTDKYPPFSGRR